MPKFNVVDEAIIDASPAVVCKAILDEISGVTHWWMPDVETKVIGDTPPGREGMISDIKVHRTGKAHFTWKLTTIVDGELIDIEYGGDFAGNGKWTFEPVDGKTRIRFYWINILPKRPLFILISPFIDLGKSHSEVMQVGFKSLNNYLNKK